jgi:hypothetical protein
MDPRPDWSKAKATPIYFIKDPSSCSKPPGVTEKSVQYRTKFKLSMVEALPLLPHSFWILRGTGTKNEFTALGKLAGSWRMHRRLQQDAEHSLLEASGTQGRALR